jgi:hypothetical protein
LTFAQDFTGYENTSVQACISEMVEAGMQRHDTFDVHGNCVVYPAEAASMTRKLFAEQWRSTLIRIITTGGVTVDPTVLDKYVAYLGIFNYIYDPLTDARENQCYDCAWLSLTALSTVTCNLWL